MEKVQTRINDEVRMLNQKILSSEEERLTFQDLFKEKIHNENQNMTELIKERQENGKNHEKAINQMMRDIIQRKDE